MKVINKEGKFFEMDSNFNLPKGDYTAIGDKLKNIYDLFEPDFKGIMTKKEQEDTLKAMTLRFEKNGVSINIK
jgi:hypothetical protein